MKSVLLIGLGKFGLLLAAQLYKLGHSVMGVDIIEKNVNAALPYVTDAQIGDSTDPQFLRSLGIDQYDVCMVAIGNDFQSSLETTSLLKEFGARLVISRADRELQAKFLRRNGADEVINPEQQIAEWAAVRYTSDHVLDYIKLDDSHALFEITVPQQWIAKTVGQIDIRKRYAVTILGIKKDGVFDFSVTPDTQLQSQETMLVLGERRAVQKCFRL